MRLDELKNDFPDIPDFVHDMIQEEVEKQVNSSNITPCLLYTSDAADEEDSVDLGGLGINKKKKKNRIAIKNK